MADLPSNADIAKGLLADVEAFEAKMQAAVDKQTALIQDTFARNQKLTEELRAPARPAPAPG